MSSSSSTFASFTEADIVSLSTSLSGCSSPTFLNTILSVWREPLNKHLLNCLGCWYLVFRHICRLCHSISTSSLRQTLHRLPMARSWWSDMYHNCYIDDPFSLLGLWELSRIATPTNDLVNVLDHGKLHDALVLATRNNKDLVYVLGSA